MQVLKFCHFSSQKKKDSCVTLTTVCSDLALSPDNQNSQSVLIPWYKTCMTGNIITCYTKKENYVLTHISQLYTSTHDTSNVKFLIQKIYRFHMLFFEVILLVIYLIENQMINIHFYRVLLLILLVIYLMYHIYISTRVVSTVKFLI